MFLLRRLLLGPSTAGLLTLAALQSMFAVESHSDSAHHDPAAPQATADEQGSQNATQEVSRQYENLPSDEDYATMSLGDLEARIENRHPAAYYTLAKRLFDADRKDEAVFWFYLGQLRYRFLLAVNVAVDPSGDPALFASLSETVGRPLNEYAFGDVPKLVATIDRVLMWDETHPNGFTPKDQEIYPTIRTGLVEFRDYIREHEVTIKVTREKNAVN